MWKCIRARNTRPCMAWTTCGGYGIGWLRHNGLAGLRRLWFRQRTDHEPVRSPATKLSFRQRSTQGVAQLIQMLERQGGCNRSGPVAGCEGSCNSPVGPASAGPSCFADRLSVRPLRVTFRCWNKGACRSRPAALRIHGAGDQPERKSLTLLHLYRQRADVETPMMNSRTSGLGRFTQDAALPGRCADRGAGL